MVAIVTDSTADLPPARAESLGIHVVPLIVTIDGVSYDDGSELPPKAYYEKLARARAIPSTSQPSPARFKELYERLEADEILSIHISGGLSGTINSAKAAAAEVPGKRIRVVDSRAVSLGLGFLAQMAATAARGGAGVDDLAELVEASVSKTGFYAVLDTLQHAQRSGRISFAQALLGSMLQIKPIITLRNGVVESLDRPRTMRRAIERVVELTTADAPLQHLAVLHANNETVAGELATRLAEAAPGGAEIVCTGAVIGTHCGPGAVAACYVRA
ncbi:MAG TPA: DegV family protein [Chloroflexota bacterium]|nr:DegV family protein [Chloroflexota bacterium]